MERTHPPGFWQSVTGSLEWKETARQAAERELFEETGLRTGSVLQDLQHLEQFPIIHPWRKLYAPNAYFNREHWFALPLPSRRTVQLQRSEHRQYRWMDATRAIARASSRTNRDAIRILSGSISL